MPIPRPILTSHTRRLLVLSGLGAALGRAAPVQWVPQAIRFPRDFGSHPDLRTEWWYITGHATAGSGAQTRAFGFQLTFFRARVDVTQGMSSRFAARQLLFAHAAVTDVQGARFRHDQRIARAGFDVASASESDTNVHLRDWSLVHQDGVYRAHVAGADFSLDLNFSETQPVLLQGAKGVSRKGPDAAQASYYYSQPQLAFEGEIAIQGQRFVVSGEGAKSANSNFTPARGAAWLDHEWSDGLLHPAAAGWDWIGMNLFDGSALMAFQMRHKTGKDVLWDGGSFRHPGMQAGVGPYIFNRGEVRFEPLRSWKSPLTQTIYPVEWIVRTPADHYIVKALLDAQELDSRNSTGAIYWEGLSDLFDSNRRHVGRGYLEMTGYARPLVL
jgi:predicted secreted hydrolase